MVEQNSLGAGLFIVIEPTSDPPEDKLRRELIALVACHGDKVKCIATAIEATGFRAAIIRSVLSGVALLDRRPAAPHHAFLANVGTAAGFLRAHFALQDDFLARVEELRLQFGQPAP